MKRSSYGEIVKQEEATQAFQMLAGLEVSGLCGKSFDNLDWDRKHRASGNARHFELFDFNETSILFVIRETEGSKYGVKTTSKHYKYYNGSEVQDVHINVAKYAKLGFEAGKIIELHLKSLAK